MIKFIYVSQGYNAMLQFPVNYEYCPMVKSETFGLETSFWEEK